MLYQRVPATLPTGALHQSNVDGGCQIRYPRLLFEILFQSTFAELVRLKSLNNPQKFTPEKRCSQQSKQNLCRLVRHGCDLSTALFGKCVSLLLLPYLNLLFPGEYTIPKGIYCHIHIYDLHRREDLYPNSTKFIPERFLPENCTDRHPFAYIPFSAGPRNCIGNLSDIRNYYSKS